MPVARWKFTLKRAKQLRADVDDRGAQAAEAKTERRELLALAARQNLSIGTVDGER